MNRYGVDVPYFTKELAALSRSLPDRTPDELERYLLRLAEVAKPQKANPKIPSFPSGQEFTDYACEELGLDERSAGIIYTWFARNVK